MVLALDLSLKLYVSTATDNNIYCFLNTLLLKYYITFVKVY